MKRGFSAGQTLVEVLMVSGLVVMVLTTIVAGVVVSTRNSAFGRDQATGTRIAQEGLEWIRSERDRLGWTAFHSHIGGGSQTFCLNDTVTGTYFDDLSAGACGAGDVIPRSNVNFMREATFTEITGSPAGYEVVVQVDWGDSHSSTLETQLYDH